MRSFAGFGCIVLAILLTPAAWDAVTNEGAPGRMTELVFHAAPAIVAWIAGVLLLARKSRNL